MAGRQSSGFDDELKESFYPQSGSFVDDVHAATAQRKKSASLSNASISQSELLYYEMSENRRGSVSMDIADIEYLMQSKNNLNSEKNLINEKNNNNIFDNNLNDLNINRNRSHSLDRIMFDKVGTEGDGMDNVRSELSYDKKIMQLERQLSNLKDEYDIACKMGQNLYKINNEKESKILMLTSENDKLKLSNQDMEYENEMLKKNGEIDISHYQRHFEELKEKLNDKEERSDDILEQLTNLKDDNARLSIENGKLKELNDILEFDNKTLKEEIEFVRSSAHEEIDNTAREFAFITEQCSELRKRNSILNDELVLYKKKCKASEKSFASLSDSISNGNHSHATLNKNNSDSNDYSSNSSNRNKSRGENMGMLDDLNREVNLKNIEIEGLNEQLTDAKEFLDDCLYLLEEIILKENFVKEDYKSHVFSDCSRVRRFLGKEGAPPQPVLNNNINDNNISYDNEFKSSHEAYEKAPSPPKKIVEVVEKVVEKIVEPEPKPKVEVKKNVLSLEAETLDSVTIERVIKEPEPEPEPEHEPEPEPEPEAEPEPVKEMEAEKGVLHEMNASNSELKRRKKKTKLKHKKVNSRREPSFEEQKVALITFLSKYSNPNNWKEAEKAGNVTKYELTFWELQPLRARMTFLYSMTLYLSQIVGINKRCISHAWMLFKSANAQIDTLSEEFELILNTLELHNDRKLWKYVFSFLFNIATYYKFVNQYIGTRTPITSSQAVTLAHNRNRSESNASNMSNGASYRRITSSGASVNSVNGVSGVKASSKSNNLSLA